VGVVGSSSDPEVTVLDIAGAGVATDAEETVPDQVEVPEVDVAVVGHVHVVQPVTLVEGEGDDASGGSDDAVDVAVDASVSTRLVSIT